MTRLLLLLPLLALPVLLPQDPSPDQDPLKRPQVRIQVEFFIAAPGEEMFRAVFSPNVVTVEGSPAALSVENQKSYLSHFNLDRSRDGETLIVDPVVEVLEEGIEITVTPYRSEGAGWGGALKVVEGSIHDLAAMKARIGDREVEIQVPDAETHTRQVSLQPREDGLWLLDLGANSAGYRRMLHVSMLEFPSAN